MATKCKSLTFAWLEPWYLAEEHELIDGMGWGMGSMGWLALILAALGIAALIKYLLSGRK